MGSNARSTDSRRLRVPLTACVALVLIGVVLAVGGVLGVQHYVLTSRILLDAADAVFARSRREVATELSRSAEPARLLVDFIAKQDVTRASTLEERMRQLPAFADALRDNAAIAALFVGYDDGSFFLVRSLRDPAVRDALGAPARAAFAVQSVEAPSLASQTFLFLDADLAILARVARSGRPFDPRTRDWYVAAMAARAGVRTAPYVFFTTREPGVTFAHKASSGRSVVGADITLASLSRLLARQAVTPSSELFLLTGDARVVAKNGTDAASRADASSGDVHLAALSGLPLVTAPALAARVAGGAAAEPFEFTAADRRFLGYVGRLDADAGTPFYLAMASPIDELLAGAREMRARSIAVTLVLLALALPLAWLVASRVSRPLRRLAGDAQQIQALDFAETAPVRSVVREVDRLGAALRTSRASLRRFVELSGALAAERSVERLIARVLDETMRLANAEAAAVHLVDAKRRVLVPAQFVRSDGEGASIALPEMALSAEPGDASPLLRAAGEGATVVVDLAREDAFARAWLHGEGERIADGALAMLATPLRDRAGEVIGVLSLLSGRVRASAIKPHVVAFIEKLSGVAAIAIETQRLLAEQKALLDALIRLVAAAIDAKSPYTAGHCQRVPALAKLLAQAACEARDGPFRDFALTADEWEALHIASWLHDCGKVTTPEYVVDKATKLSTIHDRIHEVRMRFEVLKRDAEVAFWKGRFEGGDEADLARRLAAEWHALDDEFAFVARCNEGGESMDDAAIERIGGIATRTWRRTLDDRLGISWEERARKDRRAASALPATEPLLADGPEHLIERRAQDRMPDDNPFGFHLDVPQFRDNLGELHNLTVRRGTLTAEERFRINDHIVQTIVMLENLPFPAHLANVPEIAGGHHETMDGRGYPRRLTRAQMSPLARMMAIADIFEALTAADRPYKKGKTLSESIAIMARMRDERHIDADLFDLFLASGVYRRYAETYLAPGQIDDVDVARFTSGAAVPDRAVPA